MNSFGDKDNVSYLDYSNHYITDALFVPSSKQQPELSFQNANLNPLITCPYFFDKKTEPQQHLQDAT